jgi:urea carboxylase-associated protein 2
MPSGLVKGSVETKDCHGFQQFIENNERRAGMSDVSTSTLDGARAHARSLADGTKSAGLTVPSSTAVDLPAGVEPSTVIWDETIDLGSYSSRILPRGSVLRIVDLEGDGCMQLLVYNAAQTIERLNVADTVKVQWQAYLGEGALLLSDMGRVLMTIIADSSARHDCLCGCSNRATNDRRYGDGAISGPAPNARDLLALAAAKHDLGRVDLPPNVNFFKSVRVGDEGDLTLDGAATPPTSLELRAEMDVLVLLANTPHPLDERAEYAGTTVRVAAWTGPSTDPRDPLRTATPERERAFLNTDEFITVVGQ